MYSASASVPCKITEAYGGFAECLGVLSMSPEGLQLEFIAQDGLFGVLKSGVKQLRIPWAELANLEFRPGWFSTRFLVTTTTLRTLQDLPGAEGCHLRLTVKRRHREAARELAFSVNLHLCEKELRKGTVNPRPESSSHESSEPRSARDPGGAQPPIVQ